MHGRRWHSLARDMLAHGEKGTVVASIFGVTQARISQIKVQHERRVAAAPAWVPEHMREDFALVAEERGKGVAITWANEMMRRSA